MKNNYNTDYTKRVYHPRPAARRMAQDIVKTHEERKTQLRKCQNRIEEIRGDVASARIDGMPKSNRPYTDKIGERIEQIDKLQKYIDRNCEMVEAVDNSLALIGKGRKITKAMIAEYGSKSDILFWGRKSIELSIKNNEPQCDYTKFPWRSEVIWKQERKQFLQRVADALFLGSVPEI